MLFVATINQKKRHNYRLSEKQQEKPTTFLDPLNSAEKVEEHFGYSC